MPGKAIVAATEEMFTIAPPLPAVPSGRIARRPCLMPERRAEDVDLEHLLEVLRLRVDDQRRDLDPRVVDEDVEPA